MFNRYANGVRVHADGVGPDVGDDVLRFNRFTEIDEAFAVDDG